MKGQMKKTGLLLIVCLLACLTLILCLLTSRHAVNVDEPQAGDAFLNTGKSSAAQKKMTVGEKGGMWGQSAGGQHVEMTGENRILPGGGGVFQLLSVLPQETRVRFNLPEVNLSEVVVNGR